MTREEVQQFARDLPRLALHGPVPTDTVMALADEVVNLLRELQAEPSRQPTSSLSTPPALYVDMIRDATVASLEYDRKQLAGAPSVMPGFPLAALISRVTSRIMSRLYPKTAIAATITDMIAAGELVESDDGVIALPPRLAPRAALKRKIRDVIQSDSSEGMSFSALIGKLGLAIDQLAEPVAAIGEMAAQGEIVISDVAGVIEFRLAQKDRAKGETGA